MMKKRYKIKKKHINLDLTGKTSKQKTKLTKLTLNNKSGEDRKFEYYAFDEEKIYSIRPIFVGTCV